MAQEVSYRLEVAQRRCEDMSRLHLAIECRGQGIDQELAMAGLRAHHSFLPFPSSYRLLLQIELYRANERHLHNYYYLLHEQWNRTYRIEDLQLAPER